MRTALFVYLLFFTCLAPNVYSQQQQSPRLPAITYKPNEPIDIYVNLPFAPIAPGVISTTFNTITPPYQRPNNSNPGPEDYLYNSTIDCQGMAVIGQVKQLLRCNSKRPPIRMVFRTTGSVKLTDSASGESKVYSVSSIDDFAIDKYTYIKPQPKLPGDGVATGGFVLTDRQAFYDGSVHIAEILDSVIEYSAAGLPDNHKTRSDIEFRVNQALIQLKNAQKNYMATRPSNQASPALFEDFRNRYNNILQKLGRKNLASYGTREAKLVLAQLPRTSDSIDAKIKTNRLGEIVQTFLQILLDHKLGFLAMSNDPQTTFIWKLTSTPKGAALFYSAEGYPEEKFSKTTDMLHEVLDKRYWTFKVIYGNCVKSEKVDPFREKDIALHLDFPAGCQ